MYAIASGTVSKEVGTYKYIEKGGANVLRMSMTSAIATYHV